MTLFKRAPIKEWDAESAELLKTASNRVAKLRSTDLIAWSDVAVSSMMRALEDYMENQDPASLEELTQGVITLQAVVLTLRERHALTHDD